MKNFTSSKLILAYVSIIVLTLSISCNREDDPIQKYDHGFFISNEGGFGNSDGSVSYYSYADDAVYNNIYALANGETTPGDVVQSLEVFDNEVYIVVNNSNIVIVANQTSCIRKDSILGTQSPRYFVANNKKGYLSCWGDNSVKVVDLSTKEVSKSISVGAGPEQMIISNNKLFVANSGGWGTDSVISVIDLTSEQVVDNIIVKYSPKDFVSDKDGNLWVLCYGKVVYESVEPYGIIEESPSKLYKINPVNNNILLEITLFDKQHPNYIDINADGSTLYVGGGSNYVPVYKVMIEGATATATQISDDFAYGFTYDYYTDNLFVMTAASDWISGGTLFRYSTTGEKLGEYTVGIGPNGAAFKSAE